MLRVDYSPKPAYKAFKDYVPPAAPTDAQPQPPVIPTVPAPAPSAQPSLPVRQPAATIGPAAQAPTMTLRVEKGSRITRSSTGSTRSGATKGARAVGAVRGAQGGQVQIRVQRRSGNGVWKQVRTTRTSLDANGRFAVDLKVRSGGRWRVIARYAGKTGAASSSAAFAIKRG
jgi:hypothetical protein